MTDLLLNERQLARKRQQRLHINRCVSILSDELEQHAYAEAADDLFRLYHGEPGVWAVLKRKLQERFQDAKQLMFLDLLFKVSQAGTSSELAKNYAREIPAWLESAVRWA